MRMISAERHDIMIWSQAAPSFVYIGYTPALLFIRESSSKMLAQRTTLALRQATFPSLVTRAIGRRMESTSADPRARAKLVGNVSC